MVYAEDVKKQLVTRNSVVMIVVLQVYVRRTQRSSIRTYGTYFIFEPHVHILTYFIVTHVWVSFFVLILLLLHCSRYRPHCIMRLWAIATCLDNVVLH